VGYNRILRIIIGTTADLSVDEVASFFKEKNFPEETIKILIDEKINGTVLTHMTVESLTSFGITRANSFAIDKLWRELVSKPLASPVKHRRQTKIRYVYFFAPFHRILISRLLGGSNIFLVQILSF
jgi:hypothetical protein